VKAKLVEIGWTVVFVAGALCAAYGLWLAWKPLGFVFFGTVAAIVGYGGAVEHFAKAPKGRGIR
jgi:hypothetical protein